MARQPLRPCRKPGCPAVTRDGWCDAHKPKHQRRESEDWHWLYGLSVWREELRPAQLLKEPFCRHCRENSLRVRATVVDHVVPHRGNIALFADPENLQSLCKRCHDRKSMRERQERQKNGAKF